MQAIVPQSSTPFSGYTVNFYCERLSDFEVEAILPMAAKFCLQGDSRSELLSAYLGAVESFERMRRQSIADGAEIIEASLPLVPCHYWSGPELAKALGKAIGLAMSNSGEVKLLMRHILCCLEAEVGDRLGLTNES